MSRPSRPNCKPVWRRWRKRSNQKISSAVSPEWAARIRKICAKHVAANWKSNGRGYKASLIISPQLARVWKRQSLRRMLKVTVKRSVQTQAKTQLQFPNQREQLLRETFGKSIA